MIGSDIWNCREKHFEQRVQLLSWKESNATAGLCEMRGSFRMPGNV